MLAGCCGDAEEALREVNAPADGYWHKSSVINVHSLSAARGALLVSLFPGEMSNAPTELLLEWLTYEYLHEYQPDYGGSFIIQPTSDKQNMNILTGLGNQEVNLMINLL